MKTKIQIKSIFGKILFEFEKENNTVKNTVIEAIKIKSDLREAYLREANLQEADLRGADLRGAYLREANLWRADLQGADLQGADLQEADLQEADLQDADLWNADLWNADLRGADLWRADLQGANLWRADLQGAYLQGAYLQGAYLQGAYLKKIYAVNTILSEGELIVWKKLQNNLIAKLLIPVKAKRVNCIGSRKCRFEFAKVIAIYDGKKKVNEGVGLYNSQTIYKVGKIIKPDKFDPSPLIECSNGIHAFITRQEAEYYN